MPIPKGFPLGYQYCVLHAVDREKELGAQVIVKTNRNTDGDVVQVHNPKVRHND